MLYNRKYGKKRMYKRKTYKKKSTKKISQKDQKIYNFVRTFALPRIESDNSSDIFGSIQFRLQDLPGYLELQDLFDQYRIDAIQVKFFPMTSGVYMQPFNNASTTVVFTPRFMTAIDYDDNSAPVNLDQIRQYQTYKSTMAYQQHSRYFKPCFASEVFKTAVTTGYGARRGWIDTAYPDVPHFGLKYALEATGVASNDFAFGYRIDVKMWVSFKNVK